MQQPIFSMPEFSQVDLSVVINTPVLTFILLLFLLFYIIISGILMYHWSMYGMKSAKVFLVETVFLLVSVVLFVVSFLSLYYFK